MYFGFLVIVLFGCVFAGEIGESCSTSEECTPHACVPDHDPVKNFTCQLCFDYPGNVTNYCDNPNFYVCGEAGECVLRGIFRGKMWWRDIVAIVVSVFLVFFAALGGLGGGAFVVPVMFVVGGYPFAVCSALSLTVIFGIGLGNVLFFLFQKYSGDPKGERPKIDYEIALLVEPIILAGATIGVLLNTVLPSWLSQIVFVVVVLTSSYTTLRKGFKLFFDESDKISMIKIKDRLEQEDVELKTETSTEESDFKGSETTETETETETDQESETVTQETETETEPEASETDTVVIDDSDTAAESETVADSTEVEPEPSDEESKGEDSEAGPVPEEGERSDSEDEISQLEKSLVMEERELKEIENEEDGEKKDSIFHQLKKTFVGKIVGEKGLDRTQTIWEHEKAFSIPFVEKTFRVSLDKIYKRFPLHVIIPLVFSWLVVLFSKLLMGSKKTDSIVGISDCKNPFYWVIFGITFVLLFLISYVWAPLFFLFRKNERVPVPAKKVKLEKKVLMMVKKEWEVELENTVKETMNKDKEETVKLWNLWKVLGTPMIFVSAGIVAALVGIGGGMIQNPIFYSILNLPPELVIATSCFLVFFTASSSTVLYLIGGIIQWDYFVVLVTIGLIISLGARTLQGVIEKYLGRRSIIVLICGGSILVGGIISMIVGVYTIGQDIKNKNWDNMMFKSPC